MNIEDHAKELANKMVGNWKKVDNFHWVSGSRPSDANNCCRIHLQHRDSNIGEVSNAEIIKKRFESFLGDLSEKDVSLEKVNRWDYGWGEELVIRVYDSEGNITPAFLEWAKIDLSLSNYPLLDEDDYYDREYQMKKDNVKEVGERFLEKPSEGWVEEIVSYIMCSYPEEYEQCDEYTSFKPDFIQKVLKELSFI